MDKRQWRKANGWGKENKNFVYWIKNILLYIFFPLRMTFSVCPYCHRLTGDLSHCKCTQEENKEMMRRIKEWELDYHIHCVWCSTKEHKQELVITELEDDSWTSRCPVCNVVSGTICSQIPPKIRRLYYEHK